MPFENEQNNRKPKISPDLRSALPKLGGEKAARVRDVAGRK